VTLLQRYFWQQALWPLLMALSALTALALLTQSLSTLDLIVENRQSALIFFKITLLALPQLIAIILPLATFMAILYAFNRLTVDSELMVAKASGFSPWQITSPALRLASYAMIFHLIINIIVQPLAFRHMRQALFEVRTDVASQMVQAGDFISPTPGLTIYAQDVLPNGHMRDVLIYDIRDSERPLTYIAQSGILIQNNQYARFVLLNASYQQVQDDKSLRVLEVDRDEIDLTEILTADPVMRLKASDRFLHELLRPDSRQFTHEHQRAELLSEGHARLSAPLYNIGLTLLALSFLIRGQYQRMGYGRRITICAVIGFSIRLLGFSIASAAEKNAALNSLQYGLPLALCFACAWYLLNRRRAQALHKMILPVKWS